MGRGITRLALLMLLASSGGCHGDSRSARAAAAEEGLTATSVERRGVDGKPAGGAPVHGHKIEIRMTDGMRFEPENPVVAVGDTVVWINFSQ